MPQQQQQHSESMITRLYLFDLVHLYIKTRTYSEHFNFHIKHKYTYNIAELYSYILYCE